MYHQDITVIGLLHKVVSITRSVYGEGAFYPNINSAAVRGQILPYLEVFGVRPAGPAGRFLRHDNLCHTQLVADFMFGYS